MTMSKLFPRRLFPILNALPIYFHIIILIQDKFYYYNLDEYHF